MANQKISEMPAATVPLEGTELVAIVQEGVNRAAPASAFGGGGGGGDSIPIARAQSDQFGTLQPGAIGIDSIEWNCGFPGFYVVNFTEGFFSSPPIVIVTPFFTSGAARRSAEIQYQDQDEAEVQIYSNASGSGVDCGFNIVAIQGGETE